MGSIMDPLLDWVAAKEVVWTQTKCLQSNKGLFGYSGRFSGPLLYIAIGSRG